VGQHRRRFVCHWVWNEAFRAIKPKSQLGSLMMTLPAFQVRQAKATSKSYVLSDVNSLSLALEPVHTTATPRRSMPRWWTRQTSCPACRNAWTRAASLWFSWTASQFDCACFLSYFHSWLRCELGGTMGEKPRRAASWRVALS